MGMFKVKTTIANPQTPERTFDEMFWVDTGALYCFVPEDRLHAIGLQTDAAREFILADGRRDRRLIGQADVTIEGLNERRTCVVVFAPVGSLFLLGATALENFGVEADPTRQQLRPITGVIAGHLTSLQFGH